MGRALPVSVRFCREAVFFRRKEVPSLSACRSRGEDVFPVDIRLRDRIGTLAGALGEQGRVGRPSACDKRNAGFLRCRPFILSLHGGSRLRGNYLTSIV